MITVLIQHRLRCKVATVELYRHLFHNICIWQGAYTAPLLLLSCIRRRWQAANNESKPGLAHILLHAAQRFYLCVDYYLLWASQHICVPPLLFFLALPFLSSFLPSLSLGWKKTPKPDTSCPNSKKATSKSVSRDDLWEMSFRQETFSLFSRALDS